jgi:hypothetical protein
MIFVVSFFDVGNCVVSLSNKKLTSTRSLELIINKCVQIMIVSLGIWIVRSGNFFDTSQICNC